MKVPVGLQAHRGFGRVAGEIFDNSITAIELAAQNGFLSCEIDVRLSKDGVPMVVHDPRIETSKGELEVAETDAEELQKCGLANLDQIIGCRRPGVLNIEIKSVAERKIELVGEVLKRCQAPGLYFSSFDPQILQEIPDQFLRALIVGRDTMNEYQRWDVRYEFLHVEDGIFSDEELSQQSIPTMVWTVNDIERVRQLRSIGVHGVITDTVLPNYW